MFKLKIDDFELIPEKAIKFHERISKVKNRHSVIFNCINIVQNQIAILIFQINIGLEEKYFIANQNEFNEFIQKL